MSKFFHLAKKSTSARKNGSVIINLKSANLMIGFLILFFGLGYLIQVNSLATKGYQIKELEKKITDLNQENSDLQLDALSLQSMGAVKDKVNELKMVSANETDYLQPTAVAVAR